MPVLKDHVVWERYGRTPIKYVDALEPYTHYTFNKEEAMLFTKKQAMNLRRLLTKINANPHPLGYTCGRAIYSFSQYGYSHKDQAVYS